jgi:uncharacterized membrane protein
MDPMAMLALATVVFLASHYVSSTPVRASLVSALGDNVYLGLYTGVSLVALGWMIWAYSRAPFERLWWGDEFKAWAIVFMPVSFVLLACGLLSQNPSAVRQEGALRSMGEARGILRVTRHPVQWSIALWALLHLVARGDAASAIFFGGFALLSISGTMLIDARKARTVGADWQRFAATTSNIPFAAIIQGRNRFRPGEIGWWKLGAGLAVYVVLLFAHPYLFGVRPY